MPTPAGGKNGREGKPATVDNGSSTFYKIQSKDEIVGLLNRVLKAHVLLSVSVGKSEEVFGSVILETNKEASFLVLDELYPKKKSKEPLLNQTLSIETWLEGILLNFAGKIIAVLEEDGNDYYKINLPTSLYYHQRRSSYRVPISISHPLSVDLATEDTEIMHAVLRDLSLGGLSAGLKLPAAEAIEIGDIIPNCTIQMPDGTKIECAMEIVRVNKIKASSSITIGARFTNISNPDQQVLSRAIATLDRENIKNRKRFEK